MRVAGMAGLMLAQALGAGAAPVWVALTSARPAPPEISVLASAPHETQLAIAIPGYFATALTNGGASETLFTLPGASWVLEHGRPQVPRLAVNVAVAGEGGVTVSVEPGGEVVVPVPDYRRAFEVRRGSSGVTTAVAAAQEGPFPERSAACGAPFILRDVRGVTVTIHPFRYDAIAGVMQVATSLQVRVTTAGRGAWDVRRADDGFGAVYRRQFINHRERETLSTPVAEGGRMLILAYDPFYTAMLPYLHWKRQKGIRADIVTLTQAGGTASNVQAFVQGWYATNGLTFLQLVGDAELLPAPAGTRGIMNNMVTPADPRYVLLAGNDFYPEAFVGRFPGKTEAEISNMVQRTIAYEQAPATNVGWRTLACGVASDLLAGGLHDYERMDLIRAVLTNSTYAAMDRIYDPGASLAALKAALNAGRGLVHYQGHGNRANWFTPAPQFAVADVLALTNTNRLPFVYMVGCRVGAFHATADSQAEAWLKAGTPGAPRGAVAVSAASEDQWALPPTTVQQEFTELLAGEAFQTLGGLCFNAMMKGVTVHTDVNSDPPGTEGEELYEQTHLFGDVSLMPWTSTPTAMVVVHGGTRYPGQASYTVAAVPGARCALYDPAAHVLVGTAVAGGDGTATVPSTYTNAVPLTLTVTAFNRVPHIEAVAFATNHMPAGMKLQVR